MKNTKDTLKRTILNRHTEERIKQAKSIAVMSFKGGTGKTSLTAGLGLTLVRKGYDVLWIDNDAQANLTQRVGWTSGLYRSQHRITNLLKVGDVALGDDVGINSVLQIPILIDYEYLYKLRGIGDSGKGKLGIIGGSTFASIEAQSLDERYRKDVTAFQYRSIHAFFNSAMDIYKQYFDYILFDTAPSMEGNLLNVLTVIAADEVVTPIDGFEAATGVAPMIGFAKGYTNSGDLAHKGVIKSPPNMTFAMVKYHHDLKDKESDIKNPEKEVIDSGKEDELDEIVDSDYIGQNEVFWLLKGVLGDYVCNKGVQERRKLREALSGFTTTDYTKLSLEIIEKIQKENRPNIHDSWTTEKRAVLESGLNDIEKKNLIKRPIFKTPVFR